ncbi:polyubiquitin isoform X3 [Rhodamnia argentea]|uniref:Polyubiquitin isoform X3 n=1 Tax=Rhodamnia argentea TaxID=178133 RepID=A0ABM3H9P6_9MYRT|nr:polyubiquitin isoform X3 [Rhodamnia argentea]
MSMYIRVKRSKTTYFIQCEPTETILNVKEKLQNLIDQPANDQRLILVGTGEVLEDSKSLADQKVENDAVVALTLRKGCFLFLISSYSINLYVLSPCYFPGL